jgi:cytoskeletal protein RodZ
MFSLVGTLEVVWHALGWGLAIIPGTLWFWILVVSWQHTKPEEIFQEGRSKSQASNLSHPDASSLAPEPAAKISSAILSRIARPSLHRHGF